MKKSILAICGCLLLCGCPEEATQKMVVATPAQTSARVQIQQVGIVDDWLAYNGRRGIYIITDTKTGEEYIGVSGIGISEIGSHRSGKTSTTDER